MFLDCRGLPVSSGYKQSLELFEKALSSFNLYKGDPAEIISPALIDRPEFVMGRIFLGYTYVANWQRLGISQIENILVEIRRIDPEINQREAHYIRGLEYWIIGDWDAMRLCLDKVLRDYPHDLFALQLCHLTDFYYGDAQKLCDRVANVLEEWSPNDSGFSLVLGMYAFGLEEQGQYRRSEKIAQHALEVNPFDCWARHALVHVMEMESRYQEGISLLEESKPYWSDSDNVFAGHLWWHMALFYIDVGELDSAVAVYDNEIMPRLSLFQTKLVDGASLLWRLSLSGVNILDRWTGIVEWYDKSNEQGFYAFNDMHAMLAYVGAGEHARADALMREVTKAVKSTNANAKMEKLVGFPVIAGIKAFGDGDYTNCIKELNAVRHCSHLFGGSHAQRDILWRTLVQAASLSGKQSLLRELLNERLELKPNCTYYINLLRQISIT